MSAYTALHLGLAGLCLLLAVLEWVVWRSVKKELDHLWSSITLALLAGFIACQAFISIASRPFVEFANLLNIAGPWLSVGITFAAVRSFWKALDLRSRGRRRLILLLLVSCFSARALEVTWHALRASAPTPTELIRQQAVFTYPLAAIAILGMSLLFLVDGWGSLRRRGAVGWVLAAVSVPMGVFILLDRYIAFRAAPLPTLIALVPAPYLFFVLGRLSVLAARGLRGENAHTGLGRYRRLLKLGQGGMGEAFLALRAGDFGFERWVVLKQMQADQGLEPTGLDRFLSEARISARLVHPNIVSVFELDRTNDGWYIAMEYIPGISLRDLRDLRRRGVKIPADVVAEIAMQAGRGLEHAHAAGVLHRDISPDNLMVTFDGVVKLIDFGIAKEAGGDPDVPTLQVAAPHPEHTEDGYVVGKLAYMPPERQRGAEASVSADLYALSLALLEIAYGVRPTMTIYGELLGARAADLGPLEAVLCRALAPLPENRPADAATWLAEVETAREKLPRADLIRFLRESFPGEHERATALSRLREADEATVQEVWSKERLPIIGPFALEPPTEDARAATTVAAR